MKKLIFIVIILLSACDTVTDEYETYSAAKKNQLFERGWLPDILPDTTNNIKTINDIDTNNSHGYFYIPTNDLDEFLKHLKILGKDKYLYSGSSVWYFTINPKTGYVIYKLEPEKDLKNKNSQHQNK